MAEKQTLDLQVTLWKDVKRPLTIEEVDNNFANFKTIESELGKINDLIDSLRTELKSSLESNSSHLEDLNNLKTKVNSIEKSVNSLQDAFNNFTANYTSLVSELETFESSVKPFLKYVKDKDTNPTLDLTALSADILANLDKQQLCEIFNSCGDTTSDTTSEKSSDTTNQ